MSPTTFSSLVHGVVRLLQLPGEHEVVRRPPEQIAEPDPFGELLVGKGSRLAAHQDDHVQGNALVEHRDRHQRALTGKVLGARIVWCDLEIVDDPRLVAVDEFAEQSALENRQAVLLFPRVDLFGPRAAAGNAIFRRTQPAAAERHAAIDRQQVATPLPIHADHRLGIGLVAHVAHRLDDQRHPVLPLALTIKDARWRRHMSNVLWRLCYPNRLVKLCIHSTAKCPAGVEARNRRSRLPDGTCSGERADGHLLLFLHPSNVFGNGWVLEQ